MKQKLSPVSIARVVLRGIADNKSGPQADRDAEEQVPVSIFITSTTMF